MTSSGFNWLDCGLSLADRESSLDLIKLDISRTFPSLYIFQKVRTGVLVLQLLFFFGAILIKLNLIKWLICSSLSFLHQGGPYHDILHSVLGAYTCYRPDVGYVSIILDHVSSGMFFIESLTCMWRVLGSGDVLHCCCSNSEFGGSRCLHCLCQPP